MEGMDELIKKYNIVHFDGCRFYILDLDKRSFDLESTSPYCIFIENTIIKDSSWKNMLIKIVEELDSRNQKTIDDLLRIKLDWSKANLFETSKKSNFISYRGIYLNSNHTATHFAWAIQTLLSEYSIDLSKCMMIIKRQPAAEPKEVKDFVKAETLIQFSKFLKTEYKKDQLSINIIVKNIDFLNKKLLPYISYGYNDFFLFEDPGYFYNYRKKTIEKAELLGYSPEKIKTIARQLNYLYEFIKKIHQENKLKYLDYKIPQMSEKREFEEFLNDFDSIA